MTHTNNTISGAAIYIANDYGNQNFTGTFVSLVG
jgi:hypothetical protein